MFSPPPPPPPPVTFTIVQAEVYRREFKQELTDHLNDGWKLVVLKFFSIAKRQQGFAILKKSSPQPTGE